MCAMAWITRIANRVEYLEVFYYLISDAIVELSSDAGAMKKIHEHVRELGDTLDKNHDPHSSRLWYNVSLQPVLPY
jgi:hypothetical protein